MNLHPRDTFKEQIQKMLIGPGADIFGLDDSEEIIAGYPLKTYYSGILFPERTGIKTDSSPDLLDNGEDSSDDNNNPELAEFSQKEPSKAPKDENATKDSTEANHYFPSNMGLTVCLPTSTPFIKVTFSAGRYEDLKIESSVRKIRIKRHDYEALKNNLHFPFKEELWCEEISEEEVFMSVKLNANVKESEVRNRLTPFSKNKDIDKNETALEKFQLLTFSKPFKRTVLQETIEIQIKNTEKGIPLFKEHKEFISANYFVKVIPHKGKNYVKILLANTKTHRHNEFSFTKEELNRKCLFQCGISIESSDLEPYKSYLAENPFDEEANLIEYQYRNLKSYGIGHSTSVLWDKEAIQPEWIKTTFLPEVDIPSVSNGFRTSEEYLTEIANVKKLSIWSSLSQKETCEKLTKFVEAYQNWITTQQQEANEEAFEYQNLSDGLIQKQIANSDRLLRNIDLLRTNNQVFQCFQLANTAMFIQMVISRDKRFGSVEKEAIDITDGKEVYDNITFFEEYDGLNITYRPFQLAFLLLNLEGIIDPNCKDRNEVVDLIWFPTGGGKTEAYLAVTAFTILWRRLTNPENYEGVSVIMRYTLRLLTAQQFERASRLIVALEFLRSKKAELQLGNTPISIGMWVGMATSPNTIKEAGEKIGNNTNPESDSIKYAVNQLNKLNSNYSLVTAKQKNIFQVSTCPWCGCELITQLPNKFTHAFNIDDKKKKFKITCNNISCHFESQNGLPIDVVDESLYNQPPTLLFATVDKLAMLSHQENAHRFFNSLSEGLPPDLIIQDELHLLNGPLGSIVGLFEVLVERLCSKNGRKPKIIASTATTRNTKEQIESLYGGRDVNIFPPQGISYDDNYFSQVTNKSLRKYIGFMPTGKTMIDTQVQAMLPTLLYARILLHQVRSENNQDLSDYWTIVSYYNSLKQVGKIYNKVGDEILAELRRLHKRFLPKHLLDFNYKGLVNRTTELTSRVESTKIKNVLKDLEKKWGLDEEKKYVKDTVDLVLASNMFSVGIDIGRLNVMVMNGQPKNVAEYIQASSRVARSREGLVVNLLDANLAREKSYFENYVSFHQAYYKFVEPLTVTPFTGITFHKILNGILVGYMRHIKGLNKNEDALKFDGNIEDLIELVEQRIHQSQENLKAMARKILKELADDWNKKVEDKSERNQKLFYKELIQDTSSDDQWALMKSMREVDSTSVIKINTTITTEQQDNGEEDQQ